MKARCQRCGHVGQPSIDWDRRLEVCEDCASTRLEPFSACITCGVREAVCDDLCIECVVQGYLTGGEDMEQDIELFERCEWHDPKSPWNAVRERVLAARKAAA